MLTRGSATGHGGGLSTVKRLQLPAGLFSPPIAAAMAGSCPALSSLGLVGATPTEAAGSAHMCPGYVAGSLAALCRTPSGGDGGGSAGCRDRLCRLTVYAGLRLLTPSLGDALAGMPRLTELCLPGVDVEEADGDTAAQLSRLTQLRSLQLGSCSSGGMALVLPALSRLTELRFTAAEEVSYPDSALYEAICFQAPAPALAVLEVEAGTVDTASFAQLPALQRLQVMELRATAVAPAGGWHLPPQLRELILGCGDQQLVVLPASVAAELHAPEGMVLTSVAQRMDPPLWLEVGNELLGPEGCGLTAEGQAALCRALRFLGQHLPPSARLGVNVAYFVNVSPTDGLEHAWLAELGALKGQPRIWLEDWMLSARDLRTLSRLPNVKELHFQSSSNVSSIDGNGCRLPPSALPVLVRAPALSRITIGVGDNIGSLFEFEDDLDAAGWAGELRAAIVALYLAGWQGSVQLVMPKRQEHRDAAFAGVPDLRAHGLEWDVDIFDQGSTA
jgi:hypothetical protein